MTRALLESGRGRLGAAAFLLAATLVLSFFVTLPQKPVRAGEKGVGTVAGTVVNHAGAPVSDARVTLQGADGTEPETTLTNRHGRFFFPQLPRGYYDVRAYSDGEWSAWKHNVEVKTGKQTEVRLEVIPRKKSSE